MVGKMEGTVSEPTWESIFLMNKQFPTFHLENTSYVSSRVVMLDFQSSFTPKKRRNQAGKGKNGITQKTAFGEVIGEKGTG